MPTRRTFLNTSLRWGGLGTLAGLAAILAHRSFSRSCTNSGPCGGCPQFSGCGLPKAESAKQSQTKPPYAPRPESLKTGTRVS